MTASTAIREIILRRLGIAAAETGTMQAPPILVESVVKIPRHPHFDKHKVIEVDGA